MKYKVGDKVKIRKGSLAGNIYTISHIGSCGHIELSDLPYVFFDYELEPVAPTLAEIKEKKLTCCINVKNIVEAQFLDAFFECKSYLKDYCMKKYIDWLEDIFGDDTLAFQLTDGTISGSHSTNFYRSYGDRYGEIYEFSDLFPIGSTMVCDGRTYQHTESGIKNYKLVPEYKELEEKFDEELAKHFNASSNGFRGGKKPERVLNEKQAKEYADNIMTTIESISHITGIPYENSINKLKTCLSAFPNNGISAKNGGKNSMKFTFYVTEGYRIDKSNNTRILTMTTEVLVNGKDYQCSGSATCDKTDYSEREGVLNAIANAVCGGNFDREFNKVIKNKAFANKKARTCTYCGKLFDTVAEKEVHEAWHVERKKARRERYLLRKRAKEIAFEEQAQKLAKEIIAEDNKK